MFRSNTMYVDMLDQAMKARLHTMSRRRLLGAAVVTGGSLALLGRTSGALASQDTVTESSFDSEVDVLNYALTLEHLEATFYREGLAHFDAGMFVAAGFQAGVFDRLSNIGAHEAEHVATLTSVVSSLGGEPVAEATYDFGYTDVPSFLQVAQALEDTGVAAYQGAAQYLIDNDDLLTAALTIHGNEARHAAYLALMNGGNPFPEAFNPTLTPDEVLAIAGPFISAG